MIESKVTMMLSGGSQINWFCLVVEFHLGDSATNGLFHIDFISSKYQNALSVEEPNVSPAAPVPPDLSSIKKAFGAEIVSF